MEKALTIAEVANYLAVHPKTVYNLLERGKLYGVKVGRVWRVPAEALESFLRENANRAENLTPSEAAAAEAGWRDYLAGRSKPLDQVIREQLHERAD
ncbi:MAG: helix-turn-helix domain-containing protein [Bacillota bacterium]